MKSPVICPHCGAENPPKELLCVNCSRSLPGSAARDPVRRKVAVAAMALGEAVLLLLAVALGVLIAPLVRGPLFGEAVGPAAQVASAPADTSVQPPSTTPAPAVAAPTSTPRPAGPTATPRPRTRAGSTLQVGQVGRVGPWEMVVNGVTQAPDSTEAEVDLSLRNAGSSSAALVIEPRTGASQPGTIPGLPFPLPGLEPAQPGASPDSDRVTLVAEGANGQTAFGEFFGSTEAVYTFAAAPGDVMRARILFRFREADQARTLEAFFGAARSLHFALDDTAPEQELLAPEPPISPADQPVAEIPKAWQVTVQEVRREADDRLSVRMEATNLTDSRLVALAGPNDEQGSRRDVFAVDAQGRLAWTEAENMPRIVVPAGETRAITWTLVIGDPAFEGPARLTLLSDWTADLYARVDVNVAGASSAV